MQTSGGKEEAIIMSDAEKAVVYAMSDKETSGSMGFPPTPFLLVEEFKEKGNKYHVIESWKESDIQVLRDCHFMQNIEFTAHKASEEEIEQFSREGNE